MPNITLSVDEEIIKKVREIAIDKDKTLTAMIRSYLTEGANRDQQKKEEALRSLEESFRKHGRDRGPRQWKREDLYDRPGLS